MVRRRNIEDDVVQTAIAETLSSTHGQSPDEVAAAVMDRIRPLVGAGALRTRVETAMAGAYKNGYLDGQRAGRFAPWHALIWRASKSYRELREKDRNAETTGHFSRWNY